MKFNIKLNLFDQNHYSLASFEILILNSGNISNIWIHIVYVGIYSTMHSCINYRNRIYAIGPGEACTLNYAH